MDKYKLVCLASHKGADVSEQYRIKLLKDSFGAIPLCDLTPAHLATFRDERLKLVQHQTVKRDLSILSSAINTAIIEWNIPLAMNPVSKIRWRHTDQPRDRRFEDGEESLLLNHASPCMARMITVAVETAVRRSELLRIKRNHINCSKQTLEIGLTKTGKPRTIPTIVQSLKGTQGATESVREGDSNGRATNISNYWKLIIQRFPETERRDWTGGLPLAGSSP